MPSSPDDDHSDVPSDAEAGHTDIDWGNWRQIVTTSENMSKEELCAAVVHQARNDGLRGWQAVFKHRRRAQRNGTEWHSLTFQCACDKCPWKLLFHSNRSDGGYVAKQPAKEGAHAGKGTCLEHRVAGMNIRSGAMCGSTSTRPPSSASMQRELSSAVPAPALQAVAHSPTKV